MTRTTLASTAAGLALSAAAAAHIPEADRVVDAIARANRAANRNQPLRVDLLVRIAEGPVIAQGELETRPSGVARLELRGAAGLRERHLLDSKGRSAAPTSSPPTSISNAVGSSSMTTRCAFSLNVSCTSAEKRMTVRSDRIMLPATLPPPLSGSRWRRRPARPSSSSCATIWLRKVSSSRLAARRAVSRDQRMRK